MIWNEAQANAALLHWMQELAPHGVFTTDADLCIQNWNHWLELHSGRPASTVRGRSLLELFPELVERKLDTHFRQALQGQVSVLSNALHKYLLPFAPTVNQSGFDFMQQTVRIGPLVLKDTVCGTIVTIEDVTQREAHNRRLREHAANLEVKVRERTASLDETVAQLESFSYTVAHDLRAPLRAFKGYVAALIEDFGPNLPDRAQHYIHRIRHAADGMDTLTRDLLQFSRIGKQHFTPERIDLDPIVSDIVAHSPGLQSPGVLTIQSPLLPVMGNKTLVQQCLSNLLGNAQKFGPREGQLHIVVRSELSSDDSGPENRGALPAPFISPTRSEANRRSNTAPFVRIWVEDNGIGIAPEHQRKVFGVFEQLQDSRKLEGTGIGLAIVARAVQRMNGHYGVESAPNAGSRFWIELPAATPAD